MVAVTYGVARAAARKLGGSSAAGKGKGFFARAVKAMMDARLKQAERELTLYRHLNESVGQGELPFGR